MIKRPEYHLISAGSFQGLKNIPFHSHPGVEIIYVCSGECSIEMEGHLFRGCPGTIFTIPPGLPHNQLNHETVETHFCYFHSDNEKEFAPFAFETKQDFWVEHWMNDIIKLFSESLFPLCDGLISTLLKRLDSLENKRKQEALLPKNILEAIRFLESEYTSEIILSNLAEHVGLSVSRLKSSFRQHIGISPIQYLQNVRMRKAEKMLLTPYMRISEIALACGYPDSCYFTFLFRKKHGMSPIRFREKNNV